MAVSPNSGTIMQEMDYLMEIYDKLEIPMKKVEAKEPIEKDESQASESP